MCWKDKITFVSLLCTEAPERLFYKKGTRWCKEGGGGGEPNGRYLGKSQGFRVEFVEWLNQAFWGGQLWHYPVSVWYLFLQHRTGSRKEKHQERKQLYMQMFWIYQHAHYSHWTSADIWLKVLFISPDVSEESLYLSSLTCFGFAPSVYLTELIKWFCYLLQAVSVLWTSFWIWRPQNTEFELSFHRQLIVCSLLRIRLKYPRFGIFASWGDSLVCRKPTMTSSHALIL